MRPLLRIFPGISKLSQILFVGAALLACTSEESSDELGIASTSLSSNWDQFGLLLDAESKLLIGSEIAAEENLAEALEGLVDPKREHAYLTETETWCDYLRVRGKESARRIRLDIGEFERHMTARAREIVDPVERESFLLETRARIERLREERRLLKRKELALQRCLKVVANLKS